MSVELTSSPGTDRLALPVGWTTETPWLEVDHLGRITAVNTRFCVEFGWRTDAVVGLPLITLIPLEYRDAHNIGFARFLESGKPTILGQPVQLPLLAGGGRVIKTEAVILAERRATGWRFGAQLSCKKQGD